ncbi:ATPase domain-containing protein [Haloglomus salinum]|uniref:ATPase domain-containing protein n=1 Tax=Haloglomus salinum TaxID=2962673 RepID=UPI0020C96F17|nr:ATPase domain-containing protein [Haloglomus salinum]
MTDERRSTAEDDATGGPDPEAPRDDGEAEAEPDPGHPHAGERCAFCELPIPTDGVEVSHDGETYRCCSAACRDALERVEFDPAAGGGHRRVRSGVAAFDSSLPQGFPRNAFVLLAGEAGSRDRAVHAELVWRALQRGEPVVVVSFKEPPGSVVQQFLTLEWNVLPFLESGQLHIVDCFTYRLSDRDQMFDRMDEWNAHLYDVATDATTTIRDPTDLWEVRNKVDNALEARDMVDEGLVLIDSLTELGTLVQPVQAYDFVKDLRADVSKGRFVPIFAGATIAGGHDGFPHDLGYVVDGIVEMRLNEEIIPDTLIKQARIRKLNGVLVIPEWHAYEYTSGLGMVTFDPEEEQEKTRRRRAAAARENGDAALDAGDENGDHRKGETPAPVGPESAPPDEPKPGAEARDD